MYNVIQTEEPTLTDFLSSFNDEKLKFQYGKTFERADYCYFNGYVKSISILDPNNIEGVVKGNRNYTVQIHYKENEVFASCSCPYEGVCKHTLAIIIHTSLEKIHFDDVKKTSEFDLKAYLEALSKPQLTQLILEYQTSCLR